MTPDNEMSNKAQILLSSVGANESENYDVFISYSHQNSDMAHKIKDEILTFHPNWNIFIDVSELKTGVAWQVKLYSSIGKPFSMFIVDFLEFECICVNKQFNIQT